MREAPVYVRDILEDVVNNTNTAVIAELKLANSFIEKINFQCAPWQEIHNILVLMGSSPDTQYQKYPLFAVIMPYTQKKGVLIGVDNKFTGRIIIAKNRLKEPRTPASYDINFKPILYPIMLEFLEQIDNDGRFESTKGLVPFTQVDWPYFDDGKDTNPFPDYVDVIELKDFNLTILTPNCQ